MRGRASPSSGRKKWRIFWPACQSRRGKGRRTRCRATRRVMPNDQSPCTGLRDGATPSERRYFLNIALGYWREEKAKQAWLLTGAVAVLVVLTVGIQLGINYWNRLFYDALDQREGAALLQNVFLALGLVAAAAATAVPPLLSNVGDRERGLQCRIPH